MNDSVTMGNEIQMDDVDRRKWVTADVVQSAHQISAFLLGCPENAVDGL